MSRFGSRIAQAGIVACIVGRNTAACIAWVAPVFEDSPNGLHYAFVRRHHQFWSKLAKHSFVCVSVFRCGLDDRFRNQLSRCRARQGVAFYAATCREHYR